MSLFTPHLEFGLVLSTEIFWQTGLQYKDPYPYTIYQWEHTSLVPRCGPRLDETGVDLTFDCEGGCVSNMTGMIA